MKTNEYADAYKAAHPDQYGPGTTFLSQCRCSHQAGTFIAHRPAGDSFVAGHCPHCGHCNECDCDGFEGG